MAVRMWCAKPETLRPGARWEPATEQQIARWENGNRPGMFTGYGYEVTYEGAVLALRERNGYDDSDFYAVVWNAAEGRPRHVEYASTRGWTYPNHADVDATPEVVAAYSAWQAERIAEHAAAEAAEAAATPDKGKVVRVTTGRKVPVGTVGTVIWRGVDRYGSTRWVTRYRVGIAPQGGGETVFTSQDNVEVIAQSVTDWRAVDCDCSPLRVCCCERDSDGVRTVA